MRDDPVYHKTGVLYAQYDGGAIPQPRVVQQASVASTATPADSVAAFRDFTHTRTALQRPRERLQRRADANSVSERLTTALNANRPERSTHWRQSIV